MFNMAMTPAQKVGDLLRSMRHLLDYVEELEYQANFLGALHAAGVDNWEGYSVACAIRDGEIEEDF